MLNVLRHKGASRKILWFIAIIIILSFGSFGVAYRQDTLNSAGKIFGKQVSLRDYEKAYYDSRDQLMIRYGEQANGRFDLEKEAWSRLILLEEAKKRKITVSDQDVVTQIASYPFFQQGGQFNQRVYEGFVTSYRGFNRPTKDFENGIRRTLMIERLLDNAAGQIEIPEAELKKEYILKNEKIKLLYVVFNPEDFNKGLTATDEEAKAFYEAHKESFREPPMVNVQYVHLLYPEKADDKQKEAVKQTAINISHETGPQADFLAIAKKYQQPVKDSGFFTQAQPLLTFAWSPEFVDKIFTMKQGDMSDPMEAPDGWQIIRLKERKESAVPEFSTITQKVKDAVIAQKAADLAKSKAEETLTSIKTQTKDKDFKTVAAALGLKPEETTAFSRGEYINAPGLIAEFQEESLKLNAENKLSGIVPTSQGPAILYLSSTEAVDDKKFAQDKEDFKQMMSAQRRSQILAVFVNKLKLEANLHSDLTNKVRYR